MEDSWDMTSLEAITYSAQALHSLMRASAEIESGIEHSNLRAGQVRAPNLEHHELQR